MASVAENFDLTTLLGEEAARLKSSSLVESAMVVRGNPDRFAAFTSIASLQSALTLIDSWDGAPKSARAWSSSEENAFQIFATREQLRTLYDAGFLILFEDAERFVSELRPLCRAIERDLGLAEGRVNVQIFCARKGGRGRAHFDSGYTFNCQVRGKKTWRIGKEAAVRFPSRGLFLGQTPPADLARQMHKALPVAIEDADTVVVEPGDVIMVAPGVIHETHMETESFAVAFAIEQVDTIADKIAAGIKQRLQKWPELRATRLGAQNQDIKKEFLLAAKELRRLADQLEGIKGSYE